MRENCGGNGKFNEFSASVFFSKKDGEGGENDIIAAMQSAIFVFCRESAAAFGGTGR